VVVKRSGNCKLEIAVIVNYLRSKKRVLLLCYYSRIVRAIDVRNCMVTEGVVYHCSLHQKSSRRSSVSPISSPWGISHLFRPKSRVFPQTCTI